MRIKKPGPSVPSAPLRNYKQPVIPQVTNRDRTQFWNFYADLAFLSIIIAALRKIIGKSAQYGHVSRLDLSTSAYRLLGLNLFSTRQIVYFEKQVSKTLRHTKHFLDMAKICFPKKFLSLCLQAAIQPLTICSMFLGLLFWGGH